MNSFINSRNELIEELINFLNCPVILSDQTQPEQEIPYVIYSVTTPYMPDTSLGHYTWVDSGEDLTEIRSEQPSLTISFTACGANRWMDEENYIFGEDEAQELAERAQGFFLHTGYDILDRIGFVVVEVMNAGNRTTLVVDEAARRYGFDVRLRYARSDKREVGAVRKVNVKRKGGLITNA